MLAVGYARVSVEAEDVENQVKAIEDYARVSGIELIGVFKDVGVSGSRPALEREGFKAMLNALANMPAVKAVVIYDISRLGRDMMDVVETYRYLTERLGLSVLFVKHPELNVVQGTPLGEAIRKATLALLGIAAEIERALISERTKAGLARARAQGKHVGRKGTEIPVAEVREYLSMGLTKKAVYKLLVKQGKLRYREQGQERVLSYNWFLQRLKRLGIQQP
jgi:DNA invertase Pin-like site-specific DNA recombinase